MNKGNAYFLQQVSSGMAEYRLRKELVAKEELYNDFQTLATVYQI